MPAYTFELQTYDSCLDLPTLTPDASQDLEGDGIADDCDPNDDDGVDDVSDNCPEAPNGPTLPFPWDRSDEGFVHLWLVLGPFTSGVSPGDCEPSPNSFAAHDDTAVAAVLGDTGSALRWFADSTHPTDSAVMQFTDWFAVDAPREAYAMSWLYAPDQRDAVLAIGVDDRIRPGSTAWR